MAKLVKEKESKKSLIEKVKENRFYKHIMSFVKSLGEDHISSYSSEAALFTIISFFPFLMLFFIIIHWIMMGMVLHIWMPIMFMYNYYVRLV